MAKRKKITLEIEMLKGLINVSPKTTQEVIKAVLSDLNEIDDQKLSEAAIIYYERYKKAVVKQTETKKAAKKTVIPSWNEFKNYALTKSSTTDINKLKWKYESWKENGWKTGSGRTIKNWKSTLLNTLQYMQGNEKRRAAQYTTNDQDNAVKSLFG